MNPDQPATPEKKNLLTRRAALKLAMAGVIGMSGGVGITKEVCRLVRTPPAPYHFFSAAEGRGLIAICEQIIPRDDTPGATDAGVIFYIDRQLMSVFKGHQQEYRNGLASVQKTSLHRNGVLFEQLAFDEQTRFLGLIEANQTPKEFWGGLSQAGFLSLVIDHTRQGFYGSPRHGGNRNYVSYAMMGLAYPYLIGQNRYAAGQSL